MNLHGPVRAPMSAGSGTATVTISLAAWKEGEVASTTHQLAVLRPRVAGKSEPVAREHVASLVHPDRAANVWGVRFSEDGKRLFTAGYPSGIIQVWDVENRKELRKIESPRGYRGSAEYALLTPDWKTLYVPVEERKVKTIEKDGKKTYRFEHGGETRAWDLATGKTLPPVKPAEGSAPSYAKMSPDGKSLVVIERPSFNRDEPAREKTVLVTLADGKRRVLADGFGVPVFSPDGKRLAASFHDYEAKTAEVRLLDLASGKELGKLPCPDKERHFSVTAFSPDGSLLAVDLGGKKGADREVWFLDGQTLERRARYAEKGDPDMYGWAGGGFTKDGKRYYALRPEVVDVIDVGSGKVVRTVKVGWGRAPWRHALSADGRYLIAGWAPKVDAERERDRDPDPRDLPQPRVTLIDLKEEDSPVRTLIAPHGYVGGMAISPDGKTLAFGGAGAVHLFDLTKK